MLSTTYNPIEFFKEQSLSEIKAWAELTEFYEFVEEGKSFLLIYLIPSNCCAAIVYSNTDEIPGTYLNKLKSIACQLIIADRKFKGFQPLKSSEGIPNFGTTWGIEFTHYAYL